MVSPKSRKHFLQRSRSYLRINPMLQVQRRHSRLSLPNLREWVLQSRLGIVWLQLNQYLKEKSIFPILVLFMQLFPPQTPHYSPLLSLLVLNLAEASLAHLVMLAFLILLRPTTTQNYCNAAISILLTPILILFNFHDASCIIYRSLSPNSAIVLADSGKCNNSCSSITNYGYSLLKLSLQLSTVAGAGQNTNSIAMIFLSDFYHLIKYQMHKIGVMMMGRMTESPPKKVKEIVLEVQGKTKMGNIAEYLLDMGKVEDTRVEFCLQKNGKPISDDSNITQALKYTTPVNGVLKLFLYKKGQYIAATSPRIPQKKVEVQEVRAVEYSRQQLNVEKVEEVPQKGFCCC